MPDLKSMGPAALEVGRALTDPTVQPAAKATAVLTGAAVSKATSGIAAADVLTWMGIAYTTMLILIATPKLCRTLRWWWQYLTGKERRKPFSIPPPDVPARRETDRHDTEGTHADSP